MIWVDMAGSRKLPGDYSVASFCGGGKVKIKAIAFVVPANAGTHNPWRWLLLKASTPMPERDDTAYGSRHSPGRRFI
jgi:hypothetical protein